MQRMGADCQAPGNWAVIVWPSFGLDFHGPRLRMKYQQGLGPVNTMEIPIDAGHFSAGPSA